MGYVILYDEHQIPDVEKSCKEFENWQQRFVPARCFSNFTH